LRELSCMPPCIAAGACASCGQDWLSLAPAHPTVEQHNASSKAREERLPRRPPARPFPDYTYRRSRRDAGGARRASPPRSLSRARSRAEGDSRLSAPTAEGGVSVLSALANSACGQRSREPEHYRPRSLAGLAAKNLMRWEPVMPARSNAAFDPLCGG